MYLVPSSDQSLRFIKQRVYQMLEGASDEVKIFNSKNIGELVIRTGCSQKSKTDGSEIIVVGCPNRQFFIPNQEAREWKARSDRIWNDAPDDLASFIKALTRGLEEKLVSRHRAEFIIQLTRLKRGDLQLIIHNQFRDKFPPISNQTINLLSKK